MDAEPVDAGSRAETTALLRARLLRVATTLEALDKEQLAVINKLVVMLERLEALRDYPADY
jgi:hypothetical protein